MVQDEESCRQKTGVKAVGVRMGQVPKVSAVSAMYKVTADAQQCTPETYNVCTRLIGTNWRKAPVKYGLAFIVL